LVYFSHFGMFGARKIWQPWMRWMCSKLCNMHVMKLQNIFEAEVQKLIGEIILKCLHSNFEARRRSMSTNDMSMKSTRKNAVFFHFLDLCIRLFLLIDA
jgi:hypothetical protein